ncbi:MAG: hypothetical protein U5K00_04680 [Melioribacteraceae bacterium]|nr:hypothetical protein [Melioribacteraceae bacterium]
MGLRVGAAAMNKLGVERAKDGQILAFVDLGEDHSQLAMQTDFRLSWEQHSEKATLKERTKVNGLLHLLIEQQRKR